MYQFRRAAGLFEQWSFTFYIFCSYSTLQAYNLRSWIMSLCALYNNYSIHACYFFFFSVSGKGKRADRSTKVFIKKIHFSTPSGWIWLRSVTAGVSTNHNTVIQRKFNLNLDPGSIEIQCPGSTNKQLSTPSQPGRRPRNTFQWLHRFQCISQ